MKEPTLSQFEALLGRLLLAGVLISAACLGIGLVMWLSSMAPAAAGHLLAIGLVVLMATPILRVIVSIVEYARMRDWFFVTTTTLVLLVLAGSVFFALTRT